MFLRLNFTSCRGQLVVAEEPDDPRHGDRDLDRVNPVERVGLELALELAHLAPIRKVEIQPLLTAIGEPARCG
jgi:hypothetical protein